MKLKNLTTCAVFAAITAVMAQISIPMPIGVPLTMQTFAVCLAGMLLGAKHGFISMAVYVAIGAVGVPVYSNFSGGLGVLFGIKGGFLLTFPLMALIIGFAAERSKSPAVLAAGIAVGMAVNYLGGMALFSLVSGNTLPVAFTSVVLPYIPTGVVKGVAAGVLGAKVRTRRAVPV